MSGSVDQRPKQLYEFGPFRVDPEKETVVRAGQAIALTPKTFQILLVLIRNSKDVVTKDDLMRAVWPDTFVEEGNLSRNIFMLRKALGETAQEHRYIVTVPGRGYRLAERVQVVPDQEVTLVAASRSRLRVEVKELQHWRWAVAAAVVVVAVAAGLTRYLANRHGVLGPKDTVVLADFANSTGNPVFDDALRQGLAIQLQQSPYLSLVSDQRIHRMLRLMGRAPDTPLTPEVARAICERTGSAAVLEGSITPLGTQYILGLQAKSCGTGEVLDQEQVQAARKEDVLVALGQIASRFRQRVGESLTTIQQHNMPLAEATTPSLEALEAYSAGWKVHGINGAIASLPLLQHAVELDPSFALGFSTLSRAYADLDESDRAAKAATRAWELRDHASDPEKFVIAANYQILATGNMEEARQTCEAWSHMYPRDFLSHTMLSGFPNKIAGRFEQASAEARKAIELDPDFAMGYFNLAANSVYLGRADKAERALQRAAGRGLEIDEFLMMAHDIAFLKGDDAGMSRVAAQARERSGGEAWIADKEALVAAYSGHLQRARVLSQRAVDAAKQQAQPEREGLWQAGESLRDALFGETAEARKSAAAAVARSSSREVEYGAALALAITGDSSRATATADQFAAAFPDDTLLRFNYVPVLRAQIALNQNDPARAVRLLQASVPYELGPAHALYGGLYPVYVRGEAYLAARQGTEAAIEFQKILDHRGVVGSDPIGALAHLQLGRAYILSGDKVRATQCYEAFLALWKDADPGIPILKQAHDEYAQLK